VSVCINVCIEINGESEHYLESSARMRGISRTMLVRRVIEIILNEQMILSILDDNDAPGPKTAAPKKRGNAPHVHDAPKYSKPPRDRLFDAVAQHRVPIITRVRAKTGKPSAMSRAQMEEDLRQAVLNTGGVES
jgi:hypothetical protein